MVVLGTDAHKRSHTVVAVDEAGAEIGSVTVTATPEGAFAVGEVVGTLAGSAVGDRGLPGVVPSSRS